MKTKKRDTDKKKRVAAPRLSLKEMACWMSARRNRAELLLKDFSRLLFGEQLERVKWVSANTLHLLYCDDIFLTLEVKPNCLAVILDQSWNWKSNFKKPQFLKNEDELEAFLLKLYDEWKEPNPKPKQRSRKKK